MKVLPQSMLRTPSASGFYGNFKWPLYRASHVLVDLGWVDFDLWSSTGWWDATVATYCPNRMVEHSKSKSTKPSLRGHETPCIMGWRRHQSIHSLLTDTFGTFNKYIALFYFLFDLSYPVIVLFFLLESSDMQALLGLGSCVQLDI